MLKSKGKNDHDSLKNPLTLFRISMFLKFIDSQTHTHMCTHTHTTKMASLKFFSTNVELYSTSHLTSHIICT